MPHLTEQDQAVLADRLIDIPWAVYLQGVDRIIYCPCLCLQQPCVHGNAFNMGAAHDFATTAGKTASVLGAGGVAEVEVTAYVLHYGVVWSYR